MASIIQANMHRSRTADNLIRQLVLEKETNLVLISEQYTNNISPAWYSDILGTAAIWIPDTRKCKVKKHGRGRGFVWVKCGKITYFSCYLTPNDPIHEYKQKVSEIEDAVRATNGNLIVAGDFNAKSLEWGMPTTDSRGRFLLEMAARSGLLVLNVGNVPTFRRRGHVGTIPDISFSSEALYGRVRDWRVMEDYNGSDHQYVTFDVVDDAARQNNVNSAQTIKWNVKRTDTAKFAEQLAVGPNNHQNSGINDRDAVETLARSSMDVIQAACEASIPHARPRKKRTQVHWWTEEIANLRRNCLRCRRRALRTYNVAGGRNATEAYRAAKKSLRSAINKSKARCWRELTEDVNRDPWGLGYKIATKRLGAYRAPCVLDKTTMDRIVRDLFPTHPEGRNEEPIITEEIPLFSLEELENAVLSLKPKKSPGPDGIPNEVLKLVYQFRPNLLLDMFNACIAQGIFSKIWKVGRLVLVSKKNADPEASSGYRPLCMLDTAGKLLEKLLKTRLLSAIRDAGDLSPNQYGFRAGRSTINAISEVVEAVRRAEAHNHHSRRLVLLVTLDVRNAFNTAKWSDMMEALASFNVPRYLLRIVANYLQDRYILYESEEGIHQSKLSAGAAQGSVLGPDLWNAMYDELLRLEMPDETSLIGYADDVAVVIAARDLEKAQVKLNRVMRHIMRWMTLHGLQLALNKTEVVVLTKKRIETIIHINVGNEEIQTRSAVKYLGILIDRKMTFFDQIKKTADKAEEGIMALSRLMANVSGPRSSKRRLLMGAVQSVLLYGSEIWADALEKQSYRNKLARVQRRGALRVASAYRTVSEPAVLLIAGVIPIDLLAKERRALFLKRLEESEEENGRENARIRTMEEWQRRWQGEQRGRWTARLIPDVVKWTARPHGEVDYYLTQLLSGHGYFRTYLKKIGKADSENCIYCHEDRDDAEHTFFMCSHWAAQRASLEEEVGAVTPETVVYAMIAEEQKWLSVARYAQSILRTKKRELDQEALD